MKAYIKAISYYLPERIVSNDELEKDFPEWSAKKISSKVGIDFRHISADGETAGDMAEKAAQKLFEEYNILTSEIDFILLCTQSPDYFLPTTACLLQDRLGLSTSCGALDFNLGCSGYVYGLSLAKGLVFAGVAKNVLLLTAETYNKHIHPKDKGNRSIFGDAATATLISTSGVAEIGEFALGTNGKGADDLIIRSGAMRHKEFSNCERIDESGAIQSDDHIYMNGGAIFNFTLEAVPPLVEQTLNRNNLTLDSIGQVVFHQANKFMLSTIREVCNIDTEKFFVDIRNVGNTVSNTIPIALKNAMHQQVIIKDMNVLIAGFGVGFSWGGTVLKF